MRMEGSHIRQKNQRRNDVTCTVVTALETDRLKVAGSSLLWPCRWRRDAKWIRCLPLFIVVMEVRMNPTGGPRRFRYDWRDLRSVGARTFAGSFTTLSI